MKIKHLDAQVSVSEQLLPAQLAELKAAGIDCIICNRPDHEAQDQPTFKDIAKAATSLGIDIVSIPFSGSAMTPLDVERFATALQTHTKIHAYCRTGNRSSCIWAAAKIRLGDSMQSVIEQTSAAGFDVSSSIGAVATLPKYTSGAAKPLYDVVIIGAGSAGIATAASLLKRDHNLRLVLIDPSTEHFYQPGWTMVGGGVFKPESTRRSTESLIPHNASWFKAKVESIDAANNCIQLDNGKTVYYQQLVIAPGLILDWAAIEGLEASLGRNGVTSNYRYDLAPYTWQMVRALKRGKAIFTQPPMPIKCAGAPQKALYLSADHWYKNGLIDSVENHFYNAGAVLFGVAAYVPALQTYIDKYQTQLHFNQRLIKVDGDAQTAWFSNTNSAGETSISSTKFDMIHICPPQHAPAFIAASGLADAAGWLDVDPFSLQHRQFANIWGAGDVINASNAKTMAAARKQAPVVAQNIIGALVGKTPRMAYDGYGSCPLTVESGKIVLAEFGYGGKLLPTFPKWLIDGTQATRCAWLLKSQILPAIYWHGMLKGREWLATPKPRDSV